MVEKGKTKKEKRTKPKSSKLKKNGAFTKDQAVTRDEAMKILKISNRNTLANWIKQGKVNAYIGKYDVSARPQLFFKREELERIANSDVLVRYVPDSLRVQEEPNGTDSQEEIDTSVAPKEAE